MPVGNKKPTGLSAGGLKNLVIGSTSRRFCTPTAPVAPNDDHAAPGRHTVRLQPMADRPFGLRFAEHLARNLLLPGIMSKNFRENLRESAFYCSVEFDVPGGGLPAIRAGDPHLHIVEPRGGGGRSWSLPFPRQ
jgi:hypothetical protein